MPTTQKGHWTYTIEEWTRDPFTKITNALPDDIKVVYDIGANVGGWAQVMQDKYNNALEMHCFEPMKENFDALTEYIPTAHGHMFGIFYGKDSGRLQGRGDGNVGGVFLEYLDAGEPRIFIETDTVELRELEGLKIPAPDLIKMDVEGAEENIIAHSEVVKNCKWLIIEWHPEHVDVHAFFQKHLSDHEIVVNIEDKQFLLCRK